MELVTEPVIRSAEEATRFAKELQLLLQYLGVAETNMEKGEMRVEANISLREIAEERRTNADGRGKEFILRDSASSQRESATLGTKVEVKNLNSFRSVERAVAFEIDRQTKLLDGGRKVIQETRGGDEVGEKTFSQRHKEESHDYRYFPDPDLPKLYISEIPEFNRKVLAKELPELPWQKRERYRKSFGLKDDEIEIYVGNRELANYFEGVVGYLTSTSLGMSDIPTTKLVKLASNYILSDLIGLVENSVDIRYPPRGRYLISTQADFAKLIKMVGTGVLSSRGAKDILKIMYEKGGDPESIAKKENLLQQSNVFELTKIVKKIIAENPKVVKDYKDGKPAALEFLVGQGMKVTKGSANPEILKKIIISVIS